MNMRPLVATATVVLACLCAVAAPTHAADPLPGRLPPGVSPVHYEISIEPDAAALVFSGHETIDVVVHEATRSITLNAADLAILHAQLDGVDAADIRLDGDAQTATLHFDATVSPGPHRLSFGFTGRIFTSAAGLFALDYATSDGPKRMLSTQFEVADGRRFAPMWDEPAAKATFALEVVVREHEAAYSNMPVASNRIENGKRRIRFQTSPRMSSYLLFLAVGEFERVSRQVAGVDIGVVTRKGAGASARFALDAAVELLPWFNDYFGTPYALPKLDMIAAPGSSQFFGAMENWGAIFYFESALLVDPRFSTESDRQRVFAIVAHEMAHQWFGNLVTMSWWDDLWLNEGFATWMEGKATDALHPEWKPWLQAVSGPRESALRRDAGPATHPVVLPIPSVEAANQAFDTISYSKGQSVIRMLEDMAGEVGFREGVRRYIVKYAYGNTVTDQLWAALAAATGKPVIDVAHDFTLQPGVPLVKVTTLGCEEGRTRLSLAQGRFETGNPSADRVPWRIPVRVRAVASGATADVLMERSSAAPISVEGCGPVVVNAGHAGYFRTLYAPDDLARLRASFGSLAAVDQLGLLSDAWALGEIGLVPGSTYLEFSASLPPDSDPLIWMQVADTFMRIDRTLRDSSIQAAWRAWARSRLEPIFDRVGWNARPDEPDTAGLLRESLIHALGALDDPGVIAEAKDRFARSARDPHALPAAIRQPVLKIVALHADAATWEDIHSRARKAAEPVEQQRLYEALGATRDAGLARRTLDLALSGEPPATFPSGMIVAVSSEHPALAFEYALERREAVLAMVEGSSRWGYIPWLAVYSSDAALADRVEAYARTAIPADARADAATVVAEIRHRARVRSERLPEIEGWIAGASP